MNFHLIQYLINIDRVFFERENFPYLEKLK